MASSKGYHYFLNINFFCLQIQCSVICANSDNSCTLFSVCSTIDADRFECIVYLSSDLPEVIADYGCSAHLPGIPYRKELLIGMQIKRFCQWQI